MDFIITFFYTVFFEKYLEFFISCDFFNFCWNISPNGIYIACIFIQVFFCVDFKGTHLPYKKNWMYIVRIFLDKYLFQVKKWPKHMQTPNIRKFLLTVGVLF